MKKSTNGYIIGGWTQDLNAIPPQSFSYAMYGMITNFPALTSGTAAAPGWSPAKTPAPEHSPCEIMWTYGGAGGVPSGTPNDNAEINAIVDATKENKWAGVDFDNESAMNIENIAAATTDLKKINKESSYTFLAGYDFNHSDQEAANIKFLVGNSAIDRYILMCYGGSMWPMADITANVGPSIEKTIAQGVPSKKVILALTYNGLTKENLDYFLEQVTKNEIGGLFIWEYPSLSEEDLKYITTKLQIA